MRHSLSINFYMVLYFATRGQPLCIQSPIHFPYFIQISCPRKNELLNLFDVSRECRPCWEMVRNAKKMQNATKSAAKCLAMHFLFFAFRYHFILFRWPNENTDHVNCKPNIEFLSFWCTRLQLEIIHTCKISCFLYSNWSTKTLSKFFNDATWKSISTNLNVS